MECHYTLDASGLICPLPVLKARKQLQSMQPGEILQIITTDKAAQTDFPAFCQMTGHVLLHSAATEKTGCFLSKKIYRLR